MIYDQLGNRRTPRLGHLVRVGVMAVVVLSTWQSFTGSRGVWRNVLYYVIILRQCAVQAVQRCTGLVGRYLKKHVCERALQPLHMSFFNRGPPAPAQRTSPSPYSRLPDGSQASLPPRAPPRPAPPRFDDPHEKRSYDNRRPPSVAGGGVYVTVSGPSMLTLLNLSTASPYNPARAIFSH